MKLEQIYLFQPPIVVCGRITDSQPSVKRITGLELELIDNGNTVMASLDGVVDYIPVSGNIRLYKPLQKSRPVAVPGGRK